MKLSKFDYSMFEKARQVAGTSTYKDHSLGCVIVYKRRILTMASNSGIKTHPMQKKYNRKYRHFEKSKKPVLDYGHAEILALADIPYPIEQNIDWRDVRVYVYRFRRDERLSQALARPCPACMAALRDKGVKHIYYSTDDGFAYEELY